MNVKEVAHPACIDRLNQQAVTGSVVFTFALRQETRALSDHAKKFLKALTARAYRADLWGNLKPLCGATFAEDAERIVLVSLMALDEIRRNEDWRVRWGKEWTASRAKSASTRVADAARRLKNALNEHADLCNVPSTAYWDDWGFEETLSRLFGGNSSSDNTAAKPDTSAPTMVMLLDTLEREAESLERDYAAAISVIPQPRSAREAASITFFRNRLCYFLNGRFSTARAHVLADIACAVAQAMFPGSSSRHRDATRKQIERLRSRGRKRLD